MQDFERHTVVDIVAIREQRSGSQTSKLPPSDQQKTDGIRAKVHSFTGKLLEKEENEIVDQISSDNQLIDGINYEDDLFDAKQAMDLYKRLRNALEYYRQHPQHLPIYIKCASFFSLLALYVELTANAANKPGFQYLTPEQIQFLKQVHAEIPTSIEIGKHMECLKQVALGKAAKLQRLMITKLRTRVIGRTGPVSVEQNIPSQFMEILMDVLWRMEEEEEKPCPQHAGIINTAIEKLSAVARQYSIKPELIQRTVAEACGEFKLRNPSYVARLLTQGVINELDSVRALES